jgi:hypothetical protein
VDGRPEPRRPAAGAVRPVGPGAAVDPAAHRWMVSNTQLRQEQDRCVRWRRSRPWPRSSACSTSRIGSG